jgi:hypothetical protein
VTITQTCETQVSETPNDHAPWFRCGSDWGDEHHLPGVRVDVQSYYDFLTADEGGAWEDEEIVMLDEPSSVRAAPYLTGGNRYDFTLICFAGHGGYDFRRRKTQVFLTDGPLDLESLRTGCARELIITDSCRTVIDELDDQRSIIGGDFGYEPNGSRRRSCRALYDMGIARAEAGTTFMLACDIGEAADETPEGGGEFTQHLIDAGRRWAAAAGHSWRASGLLDVRDAFLLARDAMSATHVNQTSGLTRR